VPFPLAVIALLAAVMWRDRRRRRERLAESRVSA
jgi:hypothetical protein